MEERLVYVGLDLGQSSDYSCVCILEQSKAVQVVEPLFDSDRLTWVDLSNAEALLRQPRPKTETTLRYVVRGVKRWPLNTAYMRLVADVSALMKSLESRGQVSLIPDAGGIGRPVLDLLHEQLPRTTITPIRLTGGDTEHREFGIWYVPKKDVIDTCLLCFQQERLKIPAETADERALLDELKSYERTITRAARVVFNAVAGSHDDLVMALCLALWRADRSGGSLGYLF
jgi:hypothetical protein